MEEVGHHQSGSKWWLPGLYHKPIAKNPEWILLRLEVFWGLLHKERAIMRSCQNSHWDFENLGTIRQTKTNLRTPDLQNLVNWKNKITNRLVCLNNEIDYDWLNLSFITYKICCKEKLLNWSWLKTNLTNHELLMYFLKVEFFLHWNETLSNLI